MKIKWPVAYKIFADNFVETYTKQNQLYFSDNDF